MLVNSPEGISIAQSEPPSDENRAHCLHYHPSGQVNVKNFGNARVRTLSFPPMVALRRPLFLMGMRVATVNQLNEDRKSTDFADFDFDLDAHQVSRPHAQIWIGPKGSFDEDDAGPFPHKVKLVYRDAAMYDVAYFLGDSLSIASDAIYDGHKLSDMLISFSPSSDLPSEVPLPQVSILEHWSTPHAIARQLRAHIEQLQAVVERTIGDARGQSEIRISLCKDGAICSLDWNHNFTHPGFSCEVFDFLTIRDVLAVLSGPTNVLKDVYSLDSDIVSKACSVFVRTKPKSNLANAVVFVADDLLVKRYYRIPPENVKNLEKYLRLVHR
ncbi:hypothetical protein [Caballeronia sp. GaOx3]|uniref:hypothetical protein n=1 Tax=Caballeronia sp. GaOx3 TaxID=2921740 RepID=UPI002029346B|nr:hypothetical protein [Caballeronia sp. GaOx3]